MAVDGDPQFYRRVRDNVDWQDHVLAPRTIRRAASNEMGERINIRNIVLAFIFVRINLRMKAGVGASKEEVSTGHAVNALRDPSRQERHDCFVPGRNF